MKQLKKDLQAISKSLWTLTRKSESMMKKVDKLDQTVVKPAKPKATAKPKTPRTSARRVAKEKPAMESATEKVLSVIKRSKKGLDTATLQKKTGYNSRKIWDIVHRAYKQGKIKKADRGTYVKA